MSSLRTSQVLSLVPPLVEDGHLDEYIASGRTISCAVSPTRNSLAVFASPLKVDQRVGKVSSEDYPQEQDIYVSSWHQVPTAERRLFITDTSLIFAAVQNFVSIQSDDPETMRLPKNLATFRKLAGDYIAHIQECWVHASQSITDPDGSSNFPGEHYRLMYTAMSAFQALYLPEEGIEDVPVGEELLEWLNIHFIEPSTEEGDQLSALERPWEDETFWPYLTRATLRGLSKSSAFFLQSLARHPSEYLQEIAGRLVQLLEKQPRQTNYTTEKEFFTSSRRWRDKAKALRLELDRVPDDERHDGFDNWWNSVSDLLGILEGRGDVLQRVCVELGGDWKEVVCAWGFWVDVGLRRAELPDLVGRIMYDIPLDVTDKEDTLYGELFQGRPIQALATARSIDLWLSAHLADMLAPLGLLDKEVDEDSGLTIRDQYVLDYAEYLHSDPELWRLTVDYMCTCGLIGKAMADEVLIRVPLRFSQSKATPSNGDTPRGGEGRTKIEGGDLAGIVKDLNATCFEYRREPVRRMICRIAAQQLVVIKKYGLAISYCRSAEDWLGLGHIVDRVLKEFVDHGPTQFASFVADIAPSLQELRVESGPHGVFVQRLMFAVRYAEFHHRKRNGDAENAALDLISLFEEQLAPKPWWGVLLNDAVPFLEDGSGLYFTSDNIMLLLRRLEETTLRTNQGYGEDYLGIYAQLLNTGVIEALKRLDTLRLALARYSARITLSGASVRREG